MATGLVDAAEATRNPFAMSYAMLAYGMARSAVDPASALDPLRQGLVIARQSGNRANVLYLAMTLAMTINRIEGGIADPSEALDNLALPIRSYYDSGNITQLRAALGLFVTFLRRRGDHEPASVLSGFANVSPTSAPRVQEFAVVIAQLREALGDQTYAMRAQEGAAMTMATAVAFAFDEMDRVRRELEQLP